ncbi:MAG: murein biosynthesis integral membrane protein MurJ [Thermovenabulum sp.]
MFITYFEVSPLQKTAFILMIISILSKFLGFARETFLSYFYGASSISDAYLISLTIPAVVFSFLGSGLATSYIPLISEILKEKGEKAATRFTNNLVNFIILISSFLVITVFIFTTPIVKLFASGFKEEALRIAVALSRITVFGIYFTALTYIFNSFLQLNGNFVIPALIGFPYNIVIIFSIILSSKLNNLLLLSIGSVIAIASQFLFVLPFSYKKGFRYDFILDFKDEYLKKVSILTLPVMLGTSVNQINVLIDRTIASGIIEGGISALNYANRLNGFIQDIVVSSLATVMYPLITKMAASNDEENFKKTLAENINLINLLIVPATVGLIIFSVPITRLVYGRGAFDERAVILTSGALLFYSLGMVGVGARNILSRAFYSMQDTKTPVINSIYAVIMNIILNIVLSRFMGISGIALATSISNLFCTGLLFIGLRKKIGPFGVKNVIITFFKISIASLIMGILAGFSYMKLLSFLGQNLSLLVSIIIGAFSYFLIIIFMKIEEVETLLSKARRRFL